MMTGLECNHRFCIQCWTEYLTTKIIEEGVGQTIACAASGCDILVDDATVMRLVRDPKVRMKYQHLITNSFVEVSYMSIKLFSVNNNLLFLNSVTGYCVGAHRPTVTTLLKPNILILNQ